MELKGLFFIILTLYHTLLVKVISVRIELRTLEYKACIFKIKKKTVDGLTERSDNNAFLEGAKLCSQLKLCPQQNETVK